MNIFGWIKSRSQEAIRLRFQEFHEASSEKPETFMSSLGRALNGSDKDFTPAVTPFALQEREQRNGWQ